jgi:hypothetical protein
MPTVRVEGSPDLAGLWSQIQHPVLRFPQYGRSMRLKRSAETSASSLAPNSQSVSAAKKGSAVKQGVHRTRALGPPPVPLHRRSEDGEKPPDLRALTSA